MTPAEQERYSRQMLLPGFGPAAQGRLRAARVLIAGLGGLGSPAALYLAGAGIGRLLLADFDAVDLSNLHRQPLHNSERLGRSKVDSAIESLRALNPEVALVPVKRALTAASLADLIGQVDLVLDASDNFVTRYALNSACVAARLPLVSGAAIRGEGQVAVFTGQPCYQCLYPDAGGGAETCAREGVFGPLVGIIGAMQAAEAIKLLTGWGEPLLGQLLLLDARSMQVRRLRIPADPTCPICGGQAPAP